MVRTICLGVTLLASLLCADLSQPAVAQDQTGQKTAAASENGIADHPTPTRSANFSEDEMEKLKSVVAGQEKRIQQLEQLVEAQKKLIDQALHLAPPAQTAENSASGPNPEGEKVANASAAPPAA